MEEYQRVMARLLVPGGMRQNAAQSEMVGDDEYRQLVRVRRDGGRHE